MTGVPGSSSGLPTGGSGGGGAGGSGGGSVVGGGGSGGAGGTAPEPEQYLPCETASCWLGSQLAMLCGVQALDEDFSSGLYNVHEYPLWVAQGISVELRLSPIAGSWNPALLIRNDDGVTIHDGQTSLSDGTVEVELLSTGQGGEPAAVRVTAQEHAHLSLFATSWAVVEGGFVDPMPTDTAYELRATADCEGGQLDLLTPPNFDPGDLQGGYSVLPASDPEGLYTHKHDDCSRGNELLISVLYTVAWHWHDADPSRPPIQVLDLNEAWCSSVDHATHDDGTHADLVAGCATDVSCTDKAPVLELAKLFVDTGRVCGIINDNGDVVLDQVNGYFESNLAYQPWHDTFMRSIGGHTQHFHVRVKKPDGTCN